MSNQSNRKNNKEKCQLCSKRKSVGKTPQHQKNMFRIYYVMKMNGYIFLNPIWANKMYYCWLFFWRFVYLLKKLSGKRNLWGFFPHLHTWYSGHITKEMVGWNSKFSKSWTRGIARRAIEWKKYITYIPAKLWTKLVHKHETMSKYVLHFCIFWEIS